MIQKEKRKDLKTKMKSKRIIDIYFPKKSKLGDKEEDKKSRSLKEVMEKEMIRK